MSSNIYGNININDITGDINIRSNVGGDVTIGNSASGNIGGNI